MGRQQCGADERASWRRWADAQRAVDEERPAEPGHGKVSEGSTYGRPGLTFRCGRLGEMMQNLYRDDNPEGIISLGVAENSLMVRSSPFHSAPRLTVYHPGRRPRPILPTRVSEILP